MSNEKRRSRANDKSMDAPTLLPKNNPLAGRAYVCALLGLLPGLGLLLGPIALALGVAGRRRALAGEFRPGIGHAVAAIIAGLVESLFNAAGVALIYFANS